jgi:hypothetical protein
MHNILEGIYAKALRKSILEQLPTELFLPILFFLLSEYPDTWPHLRLISCNFFVLLDYSFLELFEHVYIEVSRMSLRA